MSAVSLRRGVACLSRKVPARQMGAYALTEEFPETPAAVPATATSAGGFTASTLSNGVKVLSQATGKGAASVGLAVSAGSRFETASEGGAALLLKHMAFTSSESRSTLKIARELEAVGITPAASAGRDTILYTASGTVDTVEPAMDAVAETVMKPKMAHWEVDEVKKSLVAYELGLFAADPQLLLQESLAEAAFGTDTPMGAPYYKDPKSLTSESLMAYMLTHYTTGGMTVVGAGVSHEALVGQAESLFGSLPAAPAAAAPASPYVGGFSACKAESAMTHVALAFPGDDSAACAVFKEVLAMQSGPMSYAFGGSLVGFAGASEPAMAGSLLDQFVASVKAAASASDATIAIAKTAAKTAAFVNAEDASSAVAALAAGAPADIDSVTAADVKKFAAAALKAGPSMATVGASHALPSHAAVTKMF